ncbi:MAG: threonine/serine exporter family protein [Phycisphaerales bacterium]|nr:threonine/serine exporter family protein [Planctomycetota bacterium]MCH8507916.1 threonine/serine exporter family protein [Phycisphaerales bacterium]
MPRPRPRIIQRAEPRRDDPRARFLIEMARALGTHGMAAHRLEEAIDLAGNALGVKTQCSSTPTSVLVSIEIGEKRDTYLSRVDPRGTDLSKIVAFDELLRRVVEGRIRPAKATRIVKRIVARRQRYPAWLHIIGFAVAAAGVARFFGGGGVEILGAGVTGLGVGSLAHAAARQRHAARLLEFAAGLAAAVLASLATVVLGPASIPLITVAGLIVLMPGMTITTAMAELATRNLVSGTARITGAITVLLSIGFGVAVGKRIAGHLPGGYDAPPTPLPGWTEVVAAFIAPLGFVVLLNARAKDAWVMVLAGAGSFNLSRVLTAEIGTDLGVCATSATVGVLGNLYQRSRNRPASTIIFPGLLMLVPGVLGYRSFEFFLIEDTVTGMQTAFRVLITALALVAGLLLANVAAAPRRSL